MKSRHVLLVVGIAVALVATFSAGWVIASTTVVHTGKAETQVKVLSDSSGQDINGSVSLGWVDVPGATTTVKVPANTSALVLARFSAASECSEGSLTSDYNPCLVRILIGGQEADPVLGTASYFDSRDNGTEKGGSPPDGYEGHTVERSAGPLQAGSYTVQVQGRVSATSEILSLAGWNLTVERFRA